MKYTLVDTSKDFERALFYRSDKDPSDKDRVKSGDDVPEWYLRFIDWLDRCGFVVARIPPNILIITEQDAGNIELLFKRWKMGTDRFDYRIEFGPELFRDQVVAMVSKQPRFPEEAEARLIRIEAELIGSEDYAKHGWAAMHIDFLAEIAAESAAWFRLLITLDEMEDYNNVP